MSRWESCSTILPTIKERTSSFHWTWMNCHPTKRSSSCTIVWSTTISVRCSVQCSTLVHVCQVFSPLVPVTCASPAISLEITKVDLKLWASWAMPVQWFKQIWTFSRRSIHHQWHSRVFPWVPTKEINTYRWVFEIKLVRQLFVEHRHDIDATVRILLSLNASDSNDKATEDISEEPETDTTSKGKGRPAANRLVKVKKQRATEKHRAEVTAAASDKPLTTTNEERADVPVANDQEPVQLANTEFIRIWLLW